ncbi:tRNA (N(6)-L-threonylcarbamoyladenosine(37)-C(2))-methylthiotransferase MtaB [bacterium (candidate division B38) B3_B38]|nr:MAG: tRNA (N(6)-L-threonylcarbamoyladenosine(37)-C(2))-methylthiotransferase MtaB [bacterium (candidate division B38) B3_B38]
MKKFYIITFGCKLNQYDSAAMEEQLLASSLVKGNDYRDADIVVINTCTVTAKADSEARRWIRRVKRDNPGCRLLVTGCYAQRDPALLAKIPSVDAVFSNKEKFKLYSILSELNSGRKRIVRWSDPLKEEATHFYPLKRFSGYTRAFVKIQEGCDAKCTYCIVPRVRGRPRSLPSRIILKQIELLVDQGYKELVLTGVHIGRWCEEGKRLVHLLQMIEQIKRLPRLRLSSLEPKEVSPELIELAASSRQIVPHFHIPLQSGSDRILKLMGRPYTAAYYRRLLENIRKSVPRASIGADVIAGFPGEREEDFQQSYELIASSPLTYLHVFPFSPRPGTAAADEKGICPHREVHQRTKLLRELSRNKNYQFRLQFRGEILPCLIIGQKGTGGLLSALSDNYLKLEVEGERQLMNKIVKVRVTEVADNSTRGRFVP